MKLPVVSGSEAVKAFRKIGYEFDEQHGSHIILRHANRRTGAYLFPTIKNLPKELFGR
jgi:predicted RNA binding protein YcfA (HicA-like mRNA interferase family)